MTLREECVDREEVQTDIACSGESIIRRVGYKIIITH